ncbi:hypothetical protein PspLS_09325 [Pyricularia sp. CBS 133598]|nr:hypothetical protein PspLS_09325 [Pyricularia sp. CBS 133598]
MESVTGLCQQYAGSPLQLFGDVTKVWAEKLRDCPELTPQGFLSWSQTRRSCSSCKSGQMSNSPPTRAQPFQITKPSHPPQGQIPSPPSTAHQQPSCRIGSDDICIRAEEVLLRAMHLLADLCLVGSAGRGDVSDHRRTGVWSLARV